VRWPCAATDYGAVSSKMTTAKNRYLVTTFLFDMTFNFGRAVMPLVALSMTTASGVGASHMLTIFAGVMMFAPAIGAPLAGKVGDRIGFPACMAIASGSLALVYFGFANVTELVPLAMLGFLMGISMAFFYPCVEGAIADEAPHGKLTAYMGQYNLTWAASATIGTTLAGLAFSRFGMKSFLGGVLVAGLLFIALMMNLRRTKKAPLEKVVHEIPDDHNAAEIEMFRKASLIANFAVGGLMAVLLALGVTLTRSASNLRVTLSAIVYLFTRDSHSAFMDIIVMEGWKPLVWSMLICSFSLSKFFVFVLMSLSDIWEYRMRVLVGTQIVACLAAFLLVISGNLALHLLAFAVVGAASGVTYFSSIYYSERAGAADVGGKEDRGAKSGWHEGVLAAGAGCALIIAGFSDKIFSLVGLEFHRVPFAFGGILVAITLLAQLNFLKHRKNIRKSTK